MNNFLKLTCIRLIRVVDYGYINEWVQAFKWQLTSRVISDQFTSIMEVYSALREYDTITNKDEVIDALTKIKNNKPLI